MKHFIVLLTLLFSLGTFAQNVQKPSNSLDFIIEGRNHLKEKKYAMAIQAFDKVSRSDTNYTLAQLKKCVTYYESAQYSEAIEIAKKITFDSEEYKMGFYEWWIQSLIKLKKHSESEKITVKALSDYPLQHAFEILRAINLKEEGLYEQAKLKLQEIIKRHPFSDQAHYQLAQLVAEEGDVVRALLSVQFAILCDNEMNNLQGAYDLLRELSEDKYKATRKKEKRSDKLFKESFELIESGVGLKEKYVSDLAYNYSVIRQTDVLIKSLEYEKNSNDFWMDFYVPILLEIKKKKLIPAYTLGFVRVLQSPNIQALAKTHGENITKTNKLVYEHFMEKIKDVKYPINGVTYKGTYHYDGNSNLSGVGELVNDKKEGEWTFFQLNGKKQSILNYKNGELDGKNIWFDTQGNVKQYYTLENAKINGAGLIPQNNGLPELTANYKNSNLHGVVKSHYKNGLVKKYFEFKEGKKDGLYCEFNYGGDTIAKGRYVNGVLQGKYQEFYANGALYLETNYANDKINGPYKKFYKNGKLAFEASYLNDKEVGLSSSYHENGKLELKYTMSDAGKTDGPYFELDYYGDTSITGFIKKGSLHGLETNFVEGGKLYSKKTYAKGVLKSYQYFDSLGAIISQGKDYIICYDRYGYKYYEGQTHKKFGHNGIWKYYWKNGNLESTKTYVRGKLQGEASTYFFNGKIKEKFTYVDDEMDGYYVRYHINGNVDTEGWYVKGEMEGDWKKYSINGKLVEHSYYLNGNWGRYFLEYQNNGKQHAESFYDDGILKHITFYDSTGTIIQKNKFNLGSGDYDTKAIDQGKAFVSCQMDHSELNGPYLAFYPNNKIKVETTYKYDQKHGTYKYFFPNEKVHETGKYENGKKQGKWESYFRNGKMDEINFYKNDVLCDSSISYFDNGKICTITHYDHEGEEHGYKYEYYSNGQLECIIPYQHGIRHGSYVLYSKAGEVVIKKTYNGNYLVSYSYQKDGKWVSEIPVKEKTYVVAYYPNGQKSIEFTIENGIIKGAEIKYYSNGKLWTEYNYLDNTLHGPFKILSENGSPLKVGNYYYDYLHGNYKKYNNKGFLTDDLNYFYGDLNGLCSFYNESGKLEYSVNYYHDYAIKINKN